MNIRAVAVQAIKTPNAIDWVIYENGNFYKPTVIISDQDLERIVRQWLELHQLKIKGEK